LKDGAAENGGEKFLTPHEESREMILGKTKP